MLPCSLIITIVTTCLLGRCNTITSATHSVMYGLLMMHKVIPTCSLIITLVTTCLLGSCNTVRAVPHSLIQFACDGPSYATLQLNNHTSYNYNNYTSSLHVCLACDEPGYDALQLDNHTGHNFIPKHHVMTACDGPNQSDKQFHSYIGHIGTLLPYDKIQYPYLMQIYSHTGHNYTSLFVIEQSSLPISCFW